MNPSPVVPELTTFDAVQQLIAAALYLSIGAAALAQAPRDERTRVFFAFAFANSIALCVPAAAWFLGVRDPLAFDRIPLAVLLASLSAGAVLMFHFSQVFPTRRPWIRGSGIQLPIAYALTPVVAFVLVRWWPATAEQATMKFGFVFIVFGFPLMVLLGLVLPVASIVSFLRSLKEAAVPRPGPPRPDARPALAGILLSQIAGGALSLLVLGPLNAVAPGSVSVFIVAVTVWLLGLLTPLAYAAGVWKYGVLSIRGDLSEMEPD